MLETLLRAPSWPRLLLAFACVQIGIAAGLAGEARGGTTAAQVQDVEDALAHDPSYKVRADAALVLGRLRQIRSVPALIGALRDREAAVRASAAQALGQIGSPIAHDAVLAAMQDPEPVVRHLAHQALGRLTGADEATPAEPGEATIRARTAQKPSFAVKPVDDPSRHAGPALRSHMHDFLVDQLRPFGDVPADGQRATYAIDGVIKSVALAPGGHDVSATCTVELIVSKQSGGGMFLLTRGQATVKKSKPQWRPELGPSLEIEALEAAVRDASQDLVAQLARQ